MSVRRSTILPPPDETAAAVDIPALDANTQSWRAITETSVDTVRPPKREARDHY